VSVVSCTPGPETKPYDSRESMRAWVPVVTRAHAAIERLAGDIPLEAASQERRVALVDFFEPVDGRRRFRERLRRDRTRRENIRHC